ncbi:MAG: hypothetical protein ACOX2R_10010 [Anaerolineae bacterium]|jgi:hypothetical protein
MSLATLALWLALGAIMALVNAFALALAVRGHHGSGSQAGRRVGATLPLRLAIQGLVLYWAVRGGASSTLGWLLGYLIGRTILVGWALRRVGALGIVLRQG